MNGVIDIELSALLIGYLLLVIPIAILAYYKTGLVKDTFWAVGRMTLQLFLVGLYLEYIFELDSAFINIGWVLVMTLTASYTIVKRSQLPIRLFLAPVSIAGIISLAIIDVFFLGYVVKLDNMFSARYFIPITGMMLGNNLKTIIIALTGYYVHLKKNKNLYHWYLANGATRTEALLPFKKEALQLAFNPVIASVAVIGLIALPGMMTGQILGGSAPNVAIKYQIMLMITIFSSSILSVVLTFFFSDRSVFDGKDCMKNAILLS